MCDPVTIGIAAGSATFIGGSMKAKAEHDAAKANARRTNMINDMKFKQELQIKAHKDQVKANEYKRQLEAHSAAQTALYQQQQLNQEEQTRVSIAAQQALKETRTEMMFEDQEKLIASIQAQGTTLASSQQAGQSLLLSLMEVDRQLGIEHAQTTAAMQDANKAYRIQEWGFDLDKYGADVKAIHSLPGKPVAQSASFGPIKMPEVKGPSGLGLLGGIISSAGAGLGAGLGAAKAYDYGQTQGYL